MQPTAHERPHAVSRQAVMSLNLLGHAVLLCSVCLAGALASGGADTADDDGVLAALAGRREGDQGAGTNGFRSGGCAMAVTAGLRLESALFNLLQSLARTEMVPGGRPGGCRGGRLVDQAHEPLVPKLKSWRLTGS